MTSRFLIVGAGLIGANLAFELSRRGQRVTVIDTGLPAGGASGRSFGWVNASYFLNEDHFRLRHAAMEAHHRLARDLPEGGHRWSGCLWWEEQGTAFDQTAQTLARLGYDLHELGRAEIAAREPALGELPDRALHFPSEGALDVRRLTECLLDAAAGQGAELWLGWAANRLAIRAGRVVGVEGAMGRIEAEQTVLAAGTGARALLATAGVAFPMLSRPGAILRTRPVPPLVRHIIATPDQEFRQDETGAILAPASASHQSDTAESVRETPGTFAVTTLARLARLLPGVRLRASGIVRADRPVPGDGLPAVGAIDRLPGLAMAVLHSGVTLAPLVASGLADELTGQGIPPLLAPFRPERLLSGL